MRVPAKTLARAVSPLLIAFAVATCDLATAPGPAGTIALSFGPESTLVLGTTFEPSVSVTLDGKAVDQPRVRYVSSDPASVEIYDDGRYLLAVRRDTVTVWAELESSLSPSSAPRTARRFRVVVDSVALDRRGDTLTSLGDTTRLVATALDGNGDVVAVNDVVWITSDATVATITPAGLITALKSGDVIISAIVDNDTARANVKVNQLLDRFTFSRNSVSLDALGATATISATGVDARGSPIVGLAATWFSGNSNIAGINAAGIVTAVDNGTTFVRAVNGAVEDTVPVVVNQVATSVTISGNALVPIRALGDVARLSALALDGGNAPVVDASPSWLSTAPLIAGVNSVTGIVTALSPGTAQVIARLDGVADTVTVVVTNEATRVDAQPGSIVLTSVKDTLQFSVVVRNSLDEPIADAPVTVRSTNDAVLLVIGERQARAEAPGSAMLVVQSGSVADTVQVTVVDVPAALDIVPVSATMASVGDSLRPSVVVTNARGANAGTTSLIWSSDDPIVARVTLDGIIIARDTGQVTIRVSSVLDATKKDSIFVTVTNAPATIVTDGLLDTLTTLGQSLGYADTVRNARGALIANYPTLWSSSNTNAVSVSGEGLVTSVGFGTAMIVARAGTVADTLTVVSFNATKLYVDNSVVVSSSRFGTLKRPFDRIQDAVNTADAGDSVFVRRGSRAYAEMPSLSRRLTILGDSTAFVANGRNPSFLPTIAHDTGTAGIRVFTTAPQTIRYLAIRHSLDGAAIDADGSDLTVQWLYVNQPVVGTARIGRGISVRNSVSGTSIRNVRIRNVRGYGIRFQDVSGGSVLDDSISGIDSIPGSQPGSGIYVVHGANASVQRNVVRATQGPQVSVVGATSPVVSLNNLASQNTLVRYDSVQGSPRITLNTLDLRFQAGDDGQSSAQDDRAGVQLFNSTPPPRLFISSNTFIGQKGGTNSGSIDGVYVVNSGEWFVSSNTFISMRYGIRTLNAQGYITGNTADTAFAHIVTEGADNLYVYGETVRTMNSCILAWSGGPHNLNVDSSSFQDCTVGYDAAIDMQFGGSLRITRSRINVARRDSPAVGFSGSSFYMDSTTLAVIDSTLAGATVPDTTSGALNIYSTGGVTIRNSSIAGFGRHFGIRVTGIGSGASLDLEKTTVTRNRAGVYIAFIANFAGTLNNEIFDNRDAGLFHTDAVTLPGTWWWGDARGPRGTTAAATGDSITGGPVTMTSATAPFRPGTVAASLVRVRGNAQTAARNTILPKALTVRVIDSQGRPVSGVSVTFTRTTAGGGFPTAATFVVATNSDGLAEANFTLANAAQPNTVTAAGTSVSIGTVTFTLTGT